MLFGIGGLGALYLAWARFQAPHGFKGRWWWAPLAFILGAIVLESASFITSLHKSRQRREGPGRAKFTGDNRQPELPTLLLRKTGALLSLTLALFGVSLTLLTGDGMWDAAATALIGLLLLVLAVALARKTKSLPATAQSGVTIQIESAGADQGRSRDRSLPRGCWGRRHRNPVRRRDDREGSMNTTTSTNAPSSRALTTDPPKLPGCAEHPGAFVSSEGCACRWDFSHVPTCQVVVLVDQAAAG